MVFEVSPPTPPTPPTPSDRASLTTPSFDPSPTESAKGPGPDLSLHGKSLSDLEEKAAKQVTSAQEAHPTKEHISPQHTGEEDLEVLILARVKVWGVPGRHDTRVALAAAKAFHISQ